MKATIAGLLLAPALAAAQGVTTFLTGNLDCGLADGTCMLTSEVEVTTASLKDCQATEGFKVTVGRAGSFVCEADVEGQTAPEVQDQIARFAGFPLGTLTDGVVQELMTLSCAGPLTATVSSTEVRVYSGIRFEAGKHYVLRVTQPQAYADVFLTGSDMLALRAVTPPTNLTGRTSDYHPVLLTRESGDAGETVRIGRTSGANPLLQFETGGRKTMQFCTAAAKTGTTAATVRRFSDLLDTPSAAVQAGSAGKDVQVDQQGNLTFVDVPAPTGAVVHHDRTLKGTGAQVDPLGLSDALDQEIEALAEAVKLPVKSWTLTTVGTFEGEPGFVGQWRNAPHPTIPDRTNVGRIDPTDATFTDGATTWRLCSLTQDAGGLLEVHFCNPDPVADTGAVPALPDGWRLKVGGTSLSPHGALLGPDSLSSGRFWPNDAGQFIEAYRGYEWRAPAGLMTAGQSIEISLPPQPAEVCRVEGSTRPGEYCTLAQGGGLEWIPIPPPAEDSITPPMLQADSAAGKTAMRERIEAAGVGQASWSGDNPDPGHTLKFVVIERAEAKSTTLTYDGSTEEWIGNDVHLAAGYTGHFELGIGTKAAAPGRWTLTVDNATNVGPAEIWGQAPTHFRLSYDGGTTWVELPIERDTTLAAQFLGYRTTASNLTNPTAWGAPSDGAEEAMLWNLRLTDGSYAHPLATTYDQRAADAATVRQDLGVPDRSVVRIAGSGGVLSVVFSDGTTASVPVGTGQAQSGVTLPQVYAALAALPEFSGTDASDFAFSLAPGDVRSANLDDGDDAKRKAFRDGLEAQRKIGFGSTLPAAPNDTDLFALEADTTAPLEGRMTAAAGTVPGSIGWNPAPGPYGAVDRAPAVIDGIDWFDSTYVTAPYRTFVVVTRASGQGKVPASIVIDGNAYALRTRERDVYYTSQAFPTSPFTAGTDYAVNVRMTDGSLAWGNAPAHAGLYADTKYGWLPLNVTDRQIDDRIAPPAREGSTAAWARAKVPPGALVGRLTPNPDGGGGYLFDPAATATGDGSIGLFNGDLYVDTGSEWTHYLPAEQVEARGDSPFPAPEQAATSDYRNARIQALIHEGDDRDDHLVTLPPYLVRTATSRAGQLFHYGQSLARGDIAPFHRCTYYDEQHQESAFRGRLVCSQLAGGAGYFGPQNVRLRLASEAVSAEQTLPVSRDRHGNYLTTSVLPAKYRPVRRASASAPAGADRVLRMNWGNASAFLWTQPDQDAPKYLAPAAIGHLAAPRLLWSAVRVSGDDLFDDWTDNGWVSDQLAFIHGRPRLATIAQDSWLKVVVKIGNTPHAVSTLFPASILKALPDLTTTAGGQASNRARDRGGEPDPNVGTRDGTEIGRGNDANFRTTTNPNSIRFTLSGWQVVWLGNWNGLLSMRTDHGERMNAAGSRIELWQMGGAL